MRTCGGNCWVEGGKDVRGKGREGGGRAEDGPCAGDLNLKFSEL